MMEILSMKNEQLVSQFHGLLDGIACVEDMFPPDEPQGAFIERSNPPYLPDARAIAVNGMHKVLLSVV